MTRALRIETDPEFPARLKSKPVATVNNLFEIVGAEVDPSLAEAPWTTDVVFSLCAACGYAVDIEHFAYAVKSEQLDPPEKFGWQLCWRQRDVARLLLYLDDKRRWLPGFHTDRKTAREIERDERDAGKGLAMIAYLETLSVDELETRLQQVTEPAMKEAIQHTLRVKNSELAQK